MESKYKVGDKVRVIALHEGVEAPEDGETKYIKEIGFESVVEEVRRSLFEDGYDYILEDDIVFIFTEHMLEPVEPAAPEPKNKYKVGDKVKLLKGMSQESQESARDCGKEVLDTGAVTTVRAVRDYSEAKYGEGHSFGKFGYFLTGDDVFCYSEEVLELYDESDENVKTTPPLFDIGDNVRIVVDFGDANKKAAQLYRAKYLNKHDVALVEELIWSDKSGWLYKLKGDDAFNYREDMLILDKRQFIRESKMVRLPRGSVTETVVTSDRESYDYVTVEVDGKTMTYYMCGVGVEYKGDVMKFVKHEEKKEQSEDPMEGMVESVSEKEYSDKLGKKKDMLKSGNIGKSPETERLEEKAKELKELVNRDKSIDNADSGHISGGIVSKESLIKMDNEKIIPVCADMGKDIAEKGRELGAQLKKVGEEIMKKHNEGKFEDVISGGVISYGNLKVGKGVEIHGDDQRLLDAWDDANIGHPVPLPQGHGVENKKPSLDLSNPNNIPQYYIEFNKNTGIVYVKNILGKVLFEKAGQTEPLGEYVQGFLYSEGIKHGGYKLEVSILE